MSLSLEGPGRAAWPHLCLSTGYRASKEFAPACAGALHRPRGPPGRPTHEVRFNAWCSVLIKNYCSSWRVCGTHSARQRWETDLGGRGPMTMTTTPSGIDAVGALPWGTHFCQFYESGDDLASTLVPFFKAGLEQGERCLWVTSEPFGEEDARAALRTAVAPLDRLEEKGQIEIIDYRRWYQKAGQAFGCPSHCGMGPARARGAARGLCRASADWEHILAAGARVAAIHRIRAVGQ